MTVRDLLNQCRTALTEITAIERQIDRLMTTGAPSSGTGGGIRREKVKGNEDEYVTVRGTNNPKAAREQAVDGCEAVLEKRKQQLSEMLFEMEELLGLLGDGQARTIIRYYYGVGWTDERIAEEMEISRETVTRQRNKAIDYMEARKITDNHTSPVI